MTMLWSGTAGFTAGDISEPLVSFDDSTSTA